MMETASTQWRISSSKEDYGKEKVGEAIEEGKRGICTRWWCDASTSNERSLKTLKLVFETRTNQIGSNKS